MVDEFQVFGDFIVPVLPDQLFKINIVLHDDFVFLGRWPLADCKKLFVVFLINFCPSCWFKVFWHRFRRWWFFVLWNWFFLRIFYNIKHLLFTIFFDILANFTSSDLGLNLLSTQLFLYFFDQLWRTDVFTNGYPWPCANQKLNNF